MVLEFLKQLLALVYFHGKDLALELLNKVIQLKGENFVIKLGIIVKFSLVTSSLDAILMFL